MNSDQTLQVAHTDSAVYVKIVGRATCHCSVNFKTLMIEMIDRHFDEFILDVTDCKIMDSTFLGVLAKCADLFTKTASNGAVHKVKLLRPNDRIESLIDNLGVLSFFEVIEESTVNPDEFTEHECDPAASSKEAIAETSLEAHEELMRLNPDNVAKFKSVTEFLTKDLQKIRDRKTGE